MSGSEENEVKVEEPVMKKAKKRPTPSDVRCRLGNFFRNVQKLDESESSEDESESAEDGFESLEDESESAEDEAEASEYEAESSEDESESSEDESESSEDESESSEDESVNHMVAGEDDAPMELKPDQITERLKSLLLPDQDRLTKAGLHDYLSKSLRKPLTLRQAHALTLRHEPVPDCYLGDSSCSEDFNSLTDILLRDLPDRVTADDITNFFNQNSMEVDEIYISVDPDNDEEQVNVKLKSPEDVKRALKELNGSTICGSTICMEATPNDFRVVYIRGFDRNLGEDSLIQQLKEMFKSEEVDDAAEKKDLYLKNVFLPKKKNGRLERFGYLIYDNATDGDIAKILDTEYTTGGRKLILKRCHPRGRAFRSLLA